MQYEDERIANLILALKNLKGVGPKTIQKLLIDKKTILESTNDYTQDFLFSLEVKPITKAIEESNGIWKKAKKKATEIIDFCYEQNIVILHPYMKEYPQRLLVNQNFPTILFCKGDINLLNKEKIVAIIGTRKPTEYGKKLGFRLSSLLAEESYVVVSGLAIGSDTIGHLGALDVKGKTIAVLPTPIDAPVYPKENQRLADQIIAEGGLLISEYAPGVKLKGRQLINNLVARDEWQAGLSDGVIAIETSSKGGTNHAIKHAIKTKTPIGIFDYESRLGEEFYNDERYSGNVNYLETGKAFGIFHPETVIKFKDMMEEYHRKLQYKDLIYIKRENKVEKDLNIEQTKLF